MTDKITEPVAPEVTNPAPLGPLSGDWKDDDAEAYEDDFIAADHGPVEPLGVPHAKHTLKPATRILTRYVTVGTVNGAVADPIQLLPADPNRKSLSVVVRGAANADFMLGSDKTDCYNLNRIPVSPDNGAISLDGHTGAIWGYSQDLAPVVIAVVAVTE